MKNHLTKVLVTGANGYIGHHVVDKLLEKQNLRVLALDFNNKNIDNEAKYLNIDILENATDKNLFENLDCPDNLSHLAWQDGFNHYSENHISNLIKHFDFLCNMIDSGVKSLTVMGTAHEVGYHEGRITENTPCNPLSYYGIAKNTLRQLLFVYAKDKDVSIKWLRAYYITGDDLHNHSVFTKILEADEKGQKEFPFVSGTNQFDFIDIDVLADMIAKSALQNKVTGIINVCSGIPVALKDKVEEFIKFHNLKIKLKYGVFPQRKYDSPVIYGDNSKIQEILSASV